jgi:predicted translin family RNA/ssDNA-binding protein
MTEVVSSDAALPTPTVNRHAALRSVFESFRTTIDDQNERRERIIVSSRQVTSLSKKVIFHLLRISLIPRTAADRDEQRAKTLAEADEKVEEILGWLRKCRDDLHEADVSFWAFARNM